MKTRTGLVAWLAFVGVVVLGGAIIDVSSQTASAQIITSARCGRCDRAVPTWSQAGDTCPHCGAYWSIEQYNYETGYVYTPQPTPYQIWLIRQAQMERERQREREMKKAQWIEKMQEKREQMLAEREANRMRVSQITEEYRANFDREREANKRLRVALRVHDEGNSRAAASYCRIIIKNYSDTRAASVAESLLAKIGR